jgi:hypothetical protein
MRLLPGRRDRSNSTDSRPAGSDTGTAIRIIPANNQPRDETTMNRNEFAGLN